MSLADLPTIPIAPDGCLPALPVLACWLGHLPPDVHGCRLATIPPGTALLPELLSRFAIHHLLCDRLPIGGVWRWCAPSGASVLVASQSDALADPGDPPCHYGPLPAEATRRRSFASDYGKLLDLVRVQDAEAACRLRRTGTDLWPDLLAMLDGQLARNVPPLVDRRHWRAPGDAVQAWNPLPLSLRPLFAARLEEGEPPWSLRCDDEAQTSVQVVDGALGREIIAVLDLPALGARPITGEAEPLDSGHWSIRSDLLDNGRLRAEIGADGSLDRLCIDGWFVPQVDGGLVACRLGADRLTGTVDRQVIEDGPARARVCVTIADPRGTATITYGLIADEARLYIQATWHSGTGDEQVPDLVLATGLGAAPIRWHVDEGPPQVASQQSDLFRDRAPDLSGALALRLGWPAAPALCIDALRNREASCRDGCISIPLRRLTTFEVASDRVCIGEPEPRPIGVPALSARIVDAPPHRPDWHLADAEGLRPIWIRRDSSEWLELTLVDQLGHGGRGELLLPRDLATAPEVLVDGAFCPLRPGKDPGSWTLPFPAGGVIILRWNDGETATTTDPD